MYFHFQIVKGHCHESDITAGEGKHAQNSAWPVYELIGFGESYLNEKLHSEVHLQDAKPTQWPLTLTPERSLVTQNNPVCLWHGLITSHKGWEGVSGQRTERGKNGVKYGVHVSNRNLTEWNICPPQTLIVICCTVE